MLDESAGCPVDLACESQATRIKPTSTKFWTASILDAPTDIATTSDVIYISGQLLDTKRKYGHPVFGTTKGHDYNIRRYLYEGTKLR